MLLVVKLLLAVIIKLLAIAVYSCWQLLDITLSPLLLKLLAIVTYQLAAVA